MITPLDNLIIKKLSSWLHGQRDVIICTTITQFQQDYPLATEEQLVLLKNKLNYEMDRIYPIVDEAILQSSITRARYIFWFITFLSAVIMGGLVGFGTGQPFAFVSPLIMAFCTWFITCATIPIPYIARIRGAMNSTIVTFVKEVPLLRHLPSEDNVRSESPESSEKEAAPNLHIAIETEVNLKPLTLTRSSSLPNLRSIFSSPKPKSDESLIIAEYSHSK